jgi:hypothetical protein
LKHTGIRPGAMWMLLTLCALNLPASAARVAIPQVLRDDSRLAASLSVTVQDRPLGDLLPELGAQLGLQLSAARETADDRVTLFIRDRPGREVLGLIAEHFDFQWRRTGSGYRLGQDQPARNREQRRRQAELAAEISVLRAQIEFLAHLNPLLQAELEQALVAQRAARAEIPGELALAAQLMGRLNDATARGLVTLVQALPPPQQEHLWRGGPIRLSTWDGTLPPALELEILHLRGRTAGSPPRSGKPAGLTVTLQVTDRRPEQHMGSAPAQAVWALRAEVAQWTAEGLPWSGATWTYQAGSQHLDPPSGEPPADPALSEIVRIRLEPRPGHPLLTESPLSDVGFMLGIDGINSPLRPLGVLLHALHEETGAPLISDSFSRARARNLHTLTGGPGGAPMWQFLLRVSHDLGYEWEKRNGVIRLRSRRYALDREREVPERLLRPLRESAARRNGFDLEELAGLAAALSDDQAWHLDRYWNHYFPLPEAMPPAAPGRFATVAPHLRLWASLHPPQRQAALTAAGLPVARMSPPQRERFRQALHAPVYDLVMPVNVPPRPSRQPVFRLAYSDARRQVYSNVTPELGGVSFEGIASHPNPALLLEAQGATPAHGTPFRAMGPPFQSLDYAFHFEDEQNREPLVQPITIKLRRFLQALPKPGMPPSGPPHPGN